MRLTEPIWTGETFAYRTDFIVDDIRRDGVRHRVTEVVVGVSNFFDTQRPEDNGIDIWVRLYGHRITKTGERSKTGESGQVFHVDIQSEIAEEWKATHPISKLYSQEEEQR